MKDTNNIYDYDVWTAGEYNLSGFTINGAKYNVSNEYSVIGESSLKIKATTSDDYVRIYKLVSLPNKTVTAKIHIKTSEQIRILLREMDDGAVVNQVATFFTGVGEAVVSLNSSSSNSQFLLQIHQFTVDKPVFIDNIILTSS